MMMVIMMMMNTLLPGLCMHRRQKRGYAGGFDTPTIYVGDIDMYTPRKI